MARKLKTKVRILIECEEIITDVGLGEPVRHMHRFEYNKDFATGTTDGTQMDRAHSDEADYTTTPTDYEVFGTTLADVIDGSLSVNFSDFCVMAVSNEEANGAGNLEVFGDANGLVGAVKAANDIVLVRPEGCFVWIAPYGVAPVNGTGDIVQVAASTGTITGKHLMAGRSV